jgi:hypothetical protein
MDSPLHSLFYNFLFILFAKELRLYCYSLSAVEGVDPVRRDKLIELLDIDLQWRMHKVSDGQRRRVQICMGLLHPFKVLCNLECQTEYISYKVVPSLFQSLSSLKLILIFTCYPLPPPPLQKKKVLASKHALVSLFIELNCFAFNIS